MSAPKEKIAVLQEVMAALHFGVLQGGLEVAIEYEIEKHAVYNPTYEIGYRTLRPRDDGLFHEFKITIEVTK